MLTIIIINASWTLVFSSPFLHRPRARRRATRLRPPKRGSRVAAGSRASAARSHAAPLIATPSLTDPTPARLSHDRAANSSDRAEVRASRVESRSETRRERVRRVWGFSRRTKKKKPVPFGARRARGAARSASRARPRREMSATQPSATSADPAATKRNDVADTTDTADAVGEAAKATPKSSATRSSNESVLPEPASVSDPEHSETTTDRVASSSASRDEISSEKGGSADRLEKKDDNSSPGRSALDGDPRVPARFRRPRHRQRRRDHQGSAGAVRRAHHRRPKLPRGRAACHRHLRPSRGASPSRSGSWRSCSAAAARLGGGVGPGQAQQSVRCPKEMVGRVIGRGGETVKGLQAPQARVFRSTRARHRAWSQSRGTRDAWTRRRAPSPTSCAAEARRRTARRISEGRRWRRRRRTGGEVWRAETRGSRTETRGSARRYLSTRGSRRVIPSTRTRWRGFIRIRWRSSSTSSRLWGITGFRIRCAVILPRRRASGGVPMEGHPRASAALYGFAGNRAPVTYGYGPGPGNEAEYAYGEYGVDPAGAMYAMQMQAQMQAHMMGMGVGVGAGMGEGPHDHGAEGRGGVGLPREGQGPGESPMGAGAGCPASRWRSSSSSSRR